MKELKDVLGMVAEGLKSFAEGMEVIAGKVDALAQTLGESEAKPEVPKQKTAKVKPVKVEKKIPRKVAPKPAPVKPTVKKPVTKVIPKNVPVVPVVDDAQTATSTVFNLIRESGNGIGPTAIMEKTGFDKKKVSNILHRLKQQGKIENSTRGMYSTKG